MISRAIPPFWECCRNLPEEVKGAARQAYQHFRANPAHPSLHFERLNRDPRLWSVRVSRDYRAVGIRDDDTFIWFWIGDHREFDRGFVGSPALFDLSASLSSPSGRESITAGAGRQREPFAE